MPSWPVTATAPYTRLAADPGKVELDSLFAEIDRLARIRAVGLPPGSPRRRAS
jgi:hypothetical protein